MKDQEPRRRVELSSAEPRHFGLAVEWHFDFLAFGLVGILTFECSRDGVTLRCNWQSVIATQPNKTAPLR